MAEIESHPSLKQERLKEFFQDKPQVWLDLKEEINQMLEREIFKLKSINCENRDFVAGKCTALDDIIRLEIIYTK